jgi:hypothetical protein
MAWGNSSDVMHASIRADGIPTTGSYFVGFRVASIPQPSALALLAIGGMTLLRKRRM